MDNNTIEASSSSPSASTSNPSNHIGVGVPDLNKAVRWYHEVLGFNIVTEPMEGSADDSYLGMILKDIFGASFKKLRLAHMSFANQVGFKVFEFVDPKEEQRENNFEYWKTGFFHIGITNPNIEEVAKSIAEKGGKQRRYGRYFLASHIKQFIVKTHSAIS
jgi:catechol 2,3-dioxygenase-like lactoylglutathione lyase family enzyme